MGVVIIVFLAFLASLAWDLYSQYHAEKRVEALANELQRLADLDLQKKTADTVGGKTPQETLEMFISAVEKGDYELASKYFVIERQAKWKNDLIEVSNNQKLNTLLDPLKKASDSLGDYSDDQTKYFIHTPVLVSFILYPSGNWKIEEI